MRNKSKQRPKQPLSHVQESRVLTIVVVLLGLALLWIIFAPGTGIVTLVGKRSELAKLQEETVEIERQIETLQKDIDRLNNDPSYLEDIARKEHGLLKKNEKVYDFSKPTSVKNK
jgi:cell division protein FtsB